MQNSRQNKHLSIFISAHTRKRPDMLQALLVSWGRMDVPDNCTITCLIVEIVENDTAPHGQDWLVRMIAGYRKSDTAALLGPPLRAAKPEHDLTRFKRLMHEAISRRYHQKEVNAARRITEDTRHKLMVVTNNWLAETQLFSEENIWFDEAMRFTGGTDTKFCVQVKNRGIAVDWVPDAFVYETIPTDRLCFWYQYKRTRNQVNTNYTREVSENPDIRFNFLWDLPSKILKIILSIVTLPITRGKTIMKLSRNMGWIAGHFGAIFGTRSEHYTKVTGT